MPELRALALVTRHHEILPDTQCEAVWAKISFCKNSHKLNQKLTCQIYYLYHNTNNRQSGIQAVKADLTNTDWSFVEESTIVDDAYGLLRFNELLNFKFPMVETTYRIYFKDHKP